MALIYGWSNSTWTNTPVASSDGWVQIGGYTVSGVYSADAQVHCVYYNNDTVAKASGVYLVAIDTVRVRIVQWGSAVEYNGFLDIACSVSGVNTNISGNKTSVRGSFIKKKGDTSYTNFNLGDTSSNANGKGHLWIEVPANSNLNVSVSVTGSGTNPIKISNSALKVFYKACTLPSLSHSVALSSSTCTSLTTKYTSNIYFKTVKFYLNGTLKQTYNVSNAMGLTQSYAFTGLTPGTSYTVKVEAIRSSNNTTNTTSGTFTTPYPTRFGVWFNDNGTWRRAKGVWFNDNGTWRRAKNIYFNDNGTWRLAKKE